MENVSLSNFGFCFFFFYIKTLNMLFFLANDALSFNIRQKLV